MYSNLWSQDGEYMEKVEVRQLRCLQGQQKSNENEASFSVIEQRKTNPLAIAGEETIWSAAFLGDGACIVGGDGQETRCWQVEDAGNEVGMRGVLLRALQCHKTECGSRARQRVTT